MANNNMSENSLKNLEKGKPFDKNSADFARKAQKKSVQARKENRTMREILDYLLSKPAGNSDMSCKEAILLRSVKQAIDGDSRAREFIRDTIGEKPADKMEVTNAPVIIDNIGD